MSGLFALGSNGSGQLGLGHKEDVSVPKPVIFHCEPPSDAVVKVAAGGNHTIILTNTGKAYWSGDSSKGACGITTIGTADNAQFEELVLAEDTGGDTTLGPIVDVACTWESSTFVVRDAQGKATKVYSCGTGEQGQLGFEAQGIIEPRLIPDFPPEGLEVARIAAGLAHVVAVLSNGDVYGWGNGRKGQLGQLVVLQDGAPPPPVIHKAPCKIGGTSGVVFSVADVVCGQHSTVLVSGKEDGRILVLGPDKWGLKSNAPNSVPNWAAITGSWGGVYIHQNDGTLLAWGRDDHGQLPPPEAPKFTRIQAGSEHVIAVTEDGSVLAWGWGEHGNCGPKTDGRAGDVKGAIGAGCATSWIYIEAEGLHL
ncbi:hypothetical protein E8E14_013018 [Neopestalotiopsis sp. 37M]|nr:hypothetical protein E8E14_013018 [Neopestalotiopsis sp. 37M]